MHVSLSIEIAAKLKEFAKKRRKSMTAVVEYSLSEMFKSEEIDPRRDAALKRVLERKMTLPIGFTYRSFYLTLYMLGKRYSDDSSQEFWGAGVYRSAVDKTHGELLTEIREEWKRELS